MMINTIETYIIDLYVNRGNSNTLKFINAYYELNNIQMDTNVNEQCKILSTAHRISKQSTSYEHKRTTHNENIA